LDSGGFEADGRARCPVKRVALLSLARQCVVVEVRGVDGAEDVRVVVGPGLTDFEVRDEALENARVVELFLVLQVLVEVGALLALGAGRGQARG
jgi:hypothetical protein